MIDGIQFDVFAKHPRFSSCGLGRPSGRRPARRYFSKPLCVLIMIDAFLARNTACCIEWSSVDLDVDR